MALEFDTRRTTRDIDALFDPPTTVRKSPPPWRRNSAFRSAG